MINLKKKKETDIQFCIVGLMSWNLMCLHFCIFGRHQDRIISSPFSRHYCAKFVCKLCQRLFESFDGLVVTPASGQNFLRARLSEGLHRHHRAATGASKRIFQGEKQCASWSSTLSFREVLLQLKGTTFACITFHIRRKVWYFSANYQQNNITLWDQWYTNSRSVQWAYFTSEVDSAVSFESSEEEINIISVYTKLVFPLHFCFKRTENINRSVAH